MHALLLDSRQPLLPESLPCQTVATVGVGYQLHRRWRVELEGSYWKNDVEVMEFDKDFGEDAAPGAVAESRRLRERPVCFMVGWPVRRSKTAPCRSGPEGTVSIPISPFAVGTVTPSTA